MLQNNPLLNNYNHAASDCVDEKELLLLQKKLLTPVIEEEKKAFIEAERQRLQAAMGKEYHIKGACHVFHPLPESDQQDMQFSADPFELSLQELALLPTLVQRIPSHGTVSYLSLLRISAAEQERLDLLASLDESLDVGELCPSDAVQALLDGHDAFLSSKSITDGPVIIRE